jgi:hypothetical protein
MNGKETELHPDDRIYLDTLTIGCVLRGHGHLARVDAVPERDARRYVWSCADCPRTVSMVIPEPGSETESQNLSLPVAAADKKETELHPDDGLPIGSVGFYPIWPGSRLLRLEKEVLGEEATRSEYLFGADGVASIYVVVPHRRTGETSAAE